MESGRHPKNTEFLDLLRGFAALWVVVGHCQIWLGQTLTPLPDPRQAVDLFMLISGFLMVLTVDRRVGNGQSPAWRAFYLRRYLRIAPVYYLALLALTLCWAPYLDGFRLLREFHPGPPATTTIYDSLTLDFTNLLLHLSFLFGFSPQYSFSTMLPDWSLAIEAQFYLAFPLFYAVLRRWGCWWLFALGLVALAATRGYAWAVVHHQWPQFRETSLLIFKLAIFVAGMLLYEADRSGRRWLPLLLAAILLLLSYRGMGFEALFFLGLAAFAAWCWLAAANRVVVHVSRSRIVRFGADCSYAAYLVHGFILSLIAAPLLGPLQNTGLSRPMSAILVTILVVCLTYGVSYVIHHVLEKPGIRLGARLASREEGKVGAVVDKR